MFASLGHSDDVHSGAAGRVVGEAMVRRIGKPLAAAVSPEDEALIRSFVVSSKQERYLGFIASPRRRPKFTGALYHFADFDRACLVEIAPRDQTTEAIEVLLTRRGAPKSCYVVSTNEQIDQKTLPLAEVLRIIVGGPDGTVLSCIRWHLGYYEGESPSNRALLVRR